VGHQRAPGTPGAGGRRDPHDRRPRAVAARITSPSDACQRLDNVPSDETARKALLATLPDYATLQRQLNAALAGHLPKTLRKHPQRLAIDLTLIPYHGQPSRDPEGIYRGQAKDGTSHFHAYSSTRGRCPWPR